MDFCERLGILSSADNGGCGGAFTADNGVMISPNYPNQYPHNAQCVYTVTVHQNEVMNLTFTNLELESPIGGSCEWDYVEVREKKAAKWRISGRCWGRTPLLGPISFIFIQSSAKILPHNRLAHVGVSRGYTDYYQG